MTLRALSIAASGGRALLHQIDLIAGNLAHANAVGYKRSRAGFADTLDGVRLQGTRKLFEQGRLRPTERDLDVALEGEGFLRVLLPDRSPAFTRGGSLRIDADGNLITSEGHLVDPPVVVPPGVSKVVIDSSGSVHVPDPSEPAELLPIGQLEVSRFVDPSALAAIGPNLYRATDAAGERRDGTPGGEFGSIRQGHLEQSTVDPLRELVDLLQAQRAFELNNRAIQAVDEILQSVNTLRRKS